MLSVVATCRRQNRNVLELLTACCAARLDGSDALSLLRATWLLRSLSSLGPRRPERSLSGILAAVTRYGSGTGACGWPAASDEAKPSVTTTKAQTGVRTFETPLALRIVAKLPFLGLGLYSK
jgi:hypothetical protein